MERKGQSDSLSVQIILMKALVQGVPVSQYKAGPAAGAPPPPPPPPPQPTASPSTSAKAPGGGAAAVFAELNQGEAVTKGLRKVDKSEMTHKNPSLRAGSAVPERSTSPIRKYSLSSAL